MTEQDHPLARAFITTVEEAVVKRVRVALSLNFVVFAVLSLGVGVGYAKAISTYEKVSTVVAAQIRADEQRARETEAAREANKQFQRRQDDLASYVASCQPPPLDRKNDETYVAQKHKCWADNRANTDFDDPLLGQFLGLIAKQAGGVAACLNFEAFGYPSFAQLDAGQIKDGCRELLGGDITTFYRDQATTTR